MPTNVGPNTYGEENLVFGYDLGDVKNSYKGEPTVNLVPDATDMAGWSSYSAGNDGTFITEFGTTGYKITNRNTWNGIAKGITLPAPGTYTISAWFRIWGKSSGNNGINVYTSGGGISDTAAGGDDTKIGEWQRISMTRTYTTTSITFFIISWGGTSGVDWSSWDVTMPQVEAGSHATTFVDGTRSATQGLIDLKGNSTIDLSNMSFDSNAQMTFDGTGDHIALTGNILNVNSFTVEAVVNITSVGNYNKPIFVAGDLSTTGIWFFKHRSGLGNRLVMHGYDGVNPRIDVDSVDAVPDAENTYVAVTFDGSAYQLYMNGEPNDSAVVDNKVGATTTNYIGKQGGTYLDGDIPMMKIYNRALTASEIKANYNAVKGRFNI